MRSAASAEMCCAAAPCGQLMASGRSWMLRMVLPAREVSRQQPKAITPSAHQSTGVDGPRAQHLRRDVVWAARWRSSASALTRHSLARARGGRGRAGRRRRMHRRPSASDGRRS